MVFACMGMRSYAQTVTGEVRFNIKNAGITVDGHFNEWTADIRFDPKNLPESAIEGRVAVKSIETGIKKRDEHLQTRQYFRSADFPEVVMRSTSFRKNGKDGYTGVFEVQIKDIKKIVEIPFTVSTAKDGTSTYQGSFMVNRLDFGLGEKSIILGDEVRVEVRFVQKK
jgi:polyisoprenoid-binding protein YceI